MSVFLVRLKRLNYTTEELKLLYNSLVISRLSYCASVWAGTYSYLQDQTDRVQNKALFVDIIDEIEPIRKIICKSDQALLRKITETGYLHQLYLLLPRRTSYAADTLRPRNAGVMKAKLEKKTLYFPFESFHRSGHLICKYVLEFLSDINKSFVVVCMLMLNRRSEVS